MPAPPRHSTELEDRALFHERFAADFDASMNRYEVGKRLRLVFEDALGGGDLSGQRLLDAGCGDVPASHVA